MLFRLFCLAGRHKPDRNRIRHDNQDYVAPCRGCGKTMFKTRMGNRPWKLDDGYRPWSEAGRRGHGAG